LLDICTDAFADSVRFDFLCGDEVYGSCTELREFCEEHGRGYVLRVPSNFRLTLARGVTVTRAQAVTRTLGDERRWEVRSAGAGFKGARWYAWAWLATASPRRHVSRCCHWLALIMASEPRAGSSGSGTLANHHTSLSGARA
jgi:hypothetical protein